MLTGIMVGEGEATFRELAAYYLAQSTQLGQIAGIVYRHGGGICETPPREPTDISSLPFLYNGLEPFKNRKI